MLVFRSTLARLRPRSTFLPTSTSPRDIWNICPRSILRLTTSVTGSELLPTLRAPTNSNISTSTRRKKKTRNKPSVSTLWNKKCAAKHKICVSKCVGLSFAQIECWEWPRFSYACFWVISINLSWWRHEPLVARVLFGHGMVSILIKGMFGDVLLFLSLFLFTISRNRDVN